MTSHLLALSVGPVQEFIAAARRTRDLWFGSHLLSEISKAAAKAVEEGGGQLIFPAPETIADLEADSQLSVANVILAEVSVQNPGNLARAAKSAAQARWRQFADRVKIDYSGLISDNIWKDQVADVVEFYAAWLPYSEQSYTGDRAFLMRLLAARKRCRNFHPAKGRAGIPKSSLDGLRESVLHDPKGWSPGSRRPLRLADGEQLDVVGLVKRAWRPSAGNPTYPSVARVAADPWIRLLRTEGIDLGPLRRACEDLGPDIIHKLDTSEPSGYPQYQDFPFEGSVLFRSRHPSLAKECLAHVVRALDEISEAAKQKRIPDQPSPYLAVLVADGDRMGRALSALPSPKEHSKFSRALAGFAADARRYVERHNGVLVYAGGDDVLAFAPVDSCLECARQLHDGFAASLEKWSGCGSPPSLSVGLAIAHFMEPLEDLRAYARAAEAHAKCPRREDREQTDRDGLAIHLVKRGGGPIAIRANWSAGGSMESPDVYLQKLTRWVGAQSVPGRLAYDMHEIARAYDNWLGDAVKDAIQKDILSVIRGKQAGGESKMSEIARLIESHVTNADSLRRLANDLLVAKAIAVMPSGSSEAASPREASR